MNRFDRFSERVAPKSRLDFWARWFAAILVLNVFNTIYDYFVITRVWQETYVWEWDIIFTLFITITVVTGPLIAIGLLIIARQRRLQQELAYLAATDVLTGLRNRRAFFDDAQLALESGESHLLVVLDADHFKSINDTYGHDIGDLCLQQIARQIQDHCRQDDISGRLGGEEFAVLLKGSASMGISIGRRLCGPEGHKIPETDGARITLSGGATTLNRLGNLASAMSRADAALYEAKAGGRAQLRIAKGSTHVQRDVA